MRWLWAANVHEPRDSQLAPTFDWRTWLFLGGRGAGKTFAGAWWLTQQALRGERLALVGPTLHDVREVMVEGPSGLKAVVGRAFKPRWQASRRRLVWPNGAMAYAFSAEDPDSLRGPQFHAAWADEFCAWPKPSQTLATLRFGLRLGDDPRLAVTTTPKAGAALRALLAEPGLARTHAPTSDNEHLPPSFLESLNALYGGTRLAAQELEGLIVEDLDAALWRAEELRQCRGARPPTFDKVVVAVDPPASDRGDACGIVVAGRRERLGYVLADRTVRRVSPDAWAQRVIAAAVEFDADAIVAEANQGGDMVRGVLATNQAPCAVKLVHASKGKRVRAEPVAALYEQGRVVHCGAFPALEEELMALGSDDWRKSPDRADALVWALTELMLGGGGKPRLRSL
ncbi:MAG TPA: terminase family protein [Caulobacteraceae bacterium]|nr:terminase family protein [Caulobacteraceae bacterium]